MNRGVKKPAAHAPTFMLTEIGQWWRDDYLRKLTADCSHCGLRFELFVDVTEVDRLLLCGGNRLFTLLPNFQNKGVA